MYTYSGQLFICLPCASTLLTKWQCVSVGGRNWKIGFRSSALLHSSALPNCVNKISNSSLTSGMKILLKLGTLEMIKAKNQTPQTPVTAERTRGHAEPGCWPWGIPWGTESVCLSVTPHLGPAPSPCAQALWSQCTAMMQPKPGPSGRGGHSDFLLQVVVWRALEIMSSEKERKRIISLTAGLSSCKF